MEVRVDEPGGSAVTGPIIPEIQGQKSAHFGPERARQVERDAAGNIDPLPSDRQNPAEFDRNEQPNFQQP
jgi:hypothetical protein